VLVAHKNRRQLVLSKKGEGVPGYYERLKKLTLPNIGQLLCELVGGESGAQGTWSNRMGCLCLRMTGQFQQACVIVSPLVNTL
jgi:hypothetical protein